MRLRQSIPFMLNRQIMEFMTIKLILILILTKILIMIHLMEVLGLRFNSVRINLLVVIHLMICFLAIKFSNLELIVIICQLQMLELILIKKTHSLEKIEVLMLEELIDYQMGDQHQEEFQECPDREILLFKQKVHMIIRKNKNMIMEKINRIKEEGE